MTPRYGEGYRTWGWSIELGGGRYTRVVCGGRGGSVRGQLAMTPRYGEAGHGGGVLSQWGRGTCTPGRVGEL